MIDRKSNLKQISQVSDETAPRDTNKTLVIRGVLVLGPCFVMQHFSVLSSFKIILPRKREVVGCLTGIVFLLTRGYKC